MLHTQQTANSVGYRRDIDGLRAISVLLVVFYHLNIHFFQSGYIGVDIFFIISGFLITSHILKEHNQNNFSFKTFYLKRIRRILPAFILVLFFVTVAAFLLFLPGALKSYTRYSFSSLLFASNLYFWRFIETGYFSTDTRLIPLLHTWSLAVEEQYYILWPLVIFISAKLFKEKFVQRLVIIASIIFCISLLSAILTPVIAQHLIKTHSGFSAFLSRGLYYSPITRAFEPMLGSLLAVFYDRIKITKNKFILHSLSLLSIAIILCSGVFLNSYNYPGYTTLLPCIAATLLILLGKEKTAGGRLLSNPVFVFIGLISYSLYLWHWPIISFLYYLHINLTHSIQTIVFASSVCLAYLTWKYIEIPFRFKYKHNLFKSFSALFAGPAATTASLVLLVYFFPTIGFNTIASIPYKEANTYYGTLKKSYLCIDQKDSKLPSRKKCVIGSIKKRKFDAILVGDSHAMADTNMLNIILKDANLKAYVATQSGSPFILGNIKNWRNNDPVKRNALLAKDIEKNKYKYVIFGGYWNYYPSLPQKHQTRQQTQKKYSVFFNGFENAVKFVISHGATPVILQDTPPLLNISRFCGFAKFSHNKNACSNTLSLIEQTQADTYNFVLSLKKKFNQIILLDLRKVICDKQKCYSQIHGLPLYVSGGENSHLSAVGSTEVGKLYLKNIGNPF